MDFIYEYSIPEKTKKSVTKSQKNKKLESKIICFCNVGQKSEYSNKKRFFMAVNRISNATIEEISRDRNNTLATVVFRDRRNNRGEEQRIRMVVGPGTVVAFWTYYITLNTRFKHTFVIFTINTITFLKKDYNSVCSIEQTYFLEQCFTVGVVRFENYFYFCTIK